MFYGDAGLNESLCEWTWRHFVCFAWYGHIGDGNLHNDISLRRTVIRQQLQAKCYSDKE
jgi:hypothetical protein